MRLALTPQLHAQLARLDFLRRSVVRGTARSALRAQHRGRLAARSAPNAPHRRLPFLAHLSALAAHLASQQSTNKMAARDPLRAACARRAMLASLRAEEWQARAAIYALLASSRPSINLSAPCASLGHTRRVKVWSIASARCVLRDLTDWLARLWRTTARFVNRARIQRSRAPLNVWAHLAMRAPLALLALHPLTPAFATRVQAERGPRRQEVPPASGLHADRELLEAWLLFRLPSPSAFRAPRAHSRLQPA